MDILQLPLNPESSYWTGLSTFLPLALRSLLAGLEICMGYHSLNLGQPPARQAFSPLYHLFDFSDSVLQGSHSSQVSDMRFDPGVPKP